MGRIAAAQAAAAAAAQAAAQAAQAVARSFGRARAGHVAEAVCQAGLHVSQYSDVRRPQLFERLVRGV